MMSLKAVVREDGVTSCWAD